MLAILEKNERGFNRFFLGFAACADPRPSIAKRHWGAYAVFIDAPTHL